MKKRSRDKTKFAAKLFSGFFFLAGLSVLVLIGVSLGKETYRKRQIQKEIDSLQGKIDKMNQENGDMQNLIDYFSSDDFKDKAIRENFNLKKGDEKMVVFRKDVIQNGSSDENASNPQMVAADLSPNWQKWWKHFFGTKS